jgi:hypothetical protein
MGLFDAFNPDNYDGGQGLLARLMPGALYQNAPSAGLPQMAGTPNYGQTSNMNIGGYQMPQFGTPAQQDPAALPTNAQPTQGQLPQVPAQAPMQESAGPGFGDRLLAGIGGFTNAGGPLQALGNLVTGLATGQRMDPQGMALQQQQATYQSLIGSGVPKNLALAAALNPEVLKTIAPAYFDTKPQLQETGADPLTGKKSFSIYRPNQGTLTPVGGNGTATAQTGGSFETLNNAIQSGVKGEDLYQYLPAGMANTVKAMIEGRQQMPSTVAMRSPAILALIDAAHTIDPTFDATTWGARVAGRKDFEGGGKSSEMVRAANQTLHHVGQLINSMDDLKNGNYPALNAIGNFVNEQRGGGAPGAFRTNAHAVAEEMSKVFKGANLSDAEIRAWEQNLHENMSPEQQRAQIGKLRDLLQGSLHALEEKRVQSLGPMAAAKAGPLIQEEGQKVLEKLDQWIAGNKASAPAAAAPSLKPGGSTTINGVTIKRIN